MHRLSHQYEHWRCNGFHNVPVRCGLHRDGWQPAVHSVSWSSSFERLVKRESVVTWSPPSYLTLG